MVVHHLLAKLQEGFYQRWDKVIVLQDSSGHTQVLNKVPGHIGFVGFSAWGEYLQVIRLKYT